MRALGNGVNAEFQYVSPESKLNLRWQDDGVESNTGRFEPHPCLCATRARAPSA